MHRVLAILRITLVALIGAIVVLYTFDYLFVRYRMTKKQNRRSFRNPKDRTHLRIPHKNGSAEIVIGDPEVETCVHSLFPHMGYEPCWYLNGTSKNIIMLELLVSALRGLATSRI